jgi:hypothetical protein
MHNDEREEGERFYRDSDPNDFASLHSLVASMATLLHEQNDRINALWERAERDAPRNWGPPSNDGPPQRFLAGNLETLTGTDPDTIEGVVPLSTESADIVTMLNTGPEEEKGEEERDGAMALPRRSTRLQGKSRGNIVKGTTTVGNQWEGGLGPGDGLGVPSTAESLSHPRSKSGVGVRPQLVPEVGYFRSSHPGYFRDSLWVKLKLILPTGQRREVA